MVASVRAQTEVCIIGGGPAGAIAAIELAKLGRDVVLIERRSGTQPRGTWGDWQIESLAPSIMPILGSLGLDDLAARAAFRVERHARIAWGEGGIQVRRYGDAGPLLVDRALFDALLRAAAAEAGVHIIAAASGSPRRSEGGVWGVEVRTTSGGGKLRARFLIDARGRRPGLAKAAPGDPSALAWMVGHWRGTPNSMAETRIEALADGWLWGCPLPEDGYAITLFTDAASLAGRTKPVKHRLYRRAIAGSQLLAPVQAGRLRPGIRVGDATGRSTDDLIGHDFVRIGETAFSVDPLSSQGVQSAIVSALQGCAAAYTLLTAASDLETVQAFYRGSVQFAADRSANLAGALYAEAAKGSTAFWGQRAIHRIALPPQDALSRRSHAHGKEIRIAPDLKVVEVPALVGPVVRKVAAIQHPSLAKPAAFLGDVNLGQLILDAATLTNQDAIITAWSRRIDSATCGQILDWMLAKGFMLAPLEP